MKKSLHAFVVIVAILAPSIVRSADRPRTVLLDEAKDLVIQGLPSTTRHLPKFGLLQYEDRNFPQFYFFTAYWSGAPNGSVIIGHYAVDKSTGDVWDAVMECDEISTPALRKLQAEIRRRIGLSDSGYQKIKRKGPMCAQRVAQR